MHMLEIYTMQVRQMLSRTIFRIIINTAENTVSHISA